MPVGDDQSVKAAKALALPTRSAILAHLLTSGPLTAKEVADEFSLHANVARAHLDLLVEAGFLATGVRRKRKGRPAKVYFTWEGEMGALEDWEVSPQAQIVRLSHDEAEIDTPDCPFRDIALEHSDLVSVIDPALKEGAMGALGHPSDIEVEASVARGDASCREIIRRRETAATDSDRQVASASTKGVEHG